jgi:riboflavin kinase/FMN adenylyltransferase
VELIRRLDDLPAHVTGGAVTIGNFDGVHRGHARLIERLLATAENAGGPAIVFTFDPHPVWLLRPQAAPPPLTWIERKAELLGELGIDALVAYPTDEPLLALSPAEFFQQIVIDRLQVRGMVEGPNFFFGHDRAGNVGTLSQLCEAADVTLEIVEPLRDGEGLVSSSLVRKLIGSGDLRRANSLLTQPYRIRGMVTHGAGRGSKIGFPTANVDAIDTLLPSDGVYAAKACLEGGTWPAAVNIGPNPTFSEKAHKVEVHLIGFEGMVYGRPIEVDFFSQLRPVRPFDSIDQLKRQLRDDVQAAKAICERT